MIWGSQYDQMMIWMQGNGIKVNLETPTDLDGTTTSENTARTTGREPNDKLNNIYDLLGNSYEWTLEARNTNSRTHRGGFCGSSYSLISRYLSNPPYNTTSNNSTRLTLYIK